MAGAALAQQSAQISDLDQQAIDILNSTNQEALFRAFALLVARRQSNQVNNSAGEVADAVFSTPKSADDRRKEK